jgi:hypothetical protein
MAWAYRLFDVFRGRYLFAGWALQLVIAVERELERVRERCEKKHIALFDLKF